MHLLFRQLDEFRFKPSVLPTFTLLSGTRPAPSVGGIIWLAATFVAMLLLAFGKHIMGNQLGNDVLLTEGKVTLVDAYLAGAVFLGLILNSFLGWWWADPLASLVIVYYGVREALHALHEAAAIERAAALSHQPPPSGL